MGMQSGLWCPRCVRRRIKEHGVFNGTEGLGRVVKGLVFNDEEICSGCADELLAKVIEPEKETSTEELMRVFAMTASRARPELEAEGVEW